MKLKSKEDAFFLAKRLAIDVIDGRMDALKLEYSRDMATPAAAKRLVGALEIHSKLSELEALRSHLRNSLLFDSSWSDKSKKK